MSLLADAIIEIDYIRKDDFEVKQNEQSEVDIWFRKLSGEGWVCLFRLSPVFVVLHEHDS